ncbi:twin transmembrane helix small protein [Phaeovulum sp.]|uniref:twin transmembrane helix small protein n=1 Tax=Phaeovulum sp. TaxID=2934796 RepID=UPI00273225C0|nr:twin transmembrane helix small protein [Phaeovulum sp.]MDP1669369.1 twin transmembrane helix small protein [Phaeovulum sp.]MDP2063588.1 twin transmembrane helix small protein [Phaeovulum sp.]MDP3860697.1 twin transmembrane helix small protein [Phaeovulum sp.]MDZ4119645.1 twin transmembrane helix small protein [Phaeovulum sp.]
MAIDLSTIVIAAAVLAVLAVLVLGIGGFARGSDPKTANRRMWWRVGAQALAIALILLTFWLKSRG